MRWFACVAGAVSSHARLAARPSGVSGNASAVNGLLSFACCMMALGQESGNLPAGAAMRGGGAMVAQGDDIGRYGIVRIQ